MKLKVLYIISLLFLFVESLFSQDYSYQRDRILSLLDDPDVLQ